jgi:hypothetical protein
VFSNTGVLITYWCCTIGMWNHCKVGHTRKRHITVILTTTRYDLRASTTRALEPGARVEILVVRRESHLILGNTLAFDSKVCASAPSCFPCMGRSDWLLLSFVTFLIRLSVDAVVSPLEPSTPAWSLTGFSWLFSSRSVSTSALY